MATNPLAFHHVTPKGEDGTAVRAARHLCVLLRLRNGVSIKTISALMSGFEVTCKKSETAYRKFIDVSCIARRTSERRGFDTQDFQDAVEAAEEKWYVKIVRYNYAKWLRKEHIDAENICDFVNDHFIDLFPRRIIQIPHAGSCEDAPTKTHTAGKRRMWNVCVQNYWEVN